MLLTDYVLTLLEGLEQGSVLGLPLHSRVPTTAGIEQESCRCFLSQQCFGRHVLGSGGYSSGKEVSLLNRTLSSDRTWDNELVGAEKKMGLQRGWRSFF